MGCPFLVSSAYQNSWFWPRAMLSWFSPFPMATFVPVALSQLMPRQAAAALAALTEWPQAEGVEKSQGSSSRYVLITLLEKLLLLPLCTAHFAALGYNLESGLPSRAPRRWLCRSVPAAFQGVHKVRFLFLAPPAASTDECLHSGCFAPAPRE